MKNLIKKFGTVALAAVLLILTIMAAFVWGKKKKEKTVGSDQARGIRNNNPLNLRRTDTEWKGEKSEITDTEFEEFETMMWGLRAGLRNMRTKIQQGYKTLGSLISVWAPPTENKTSNYIDLVVKATGYDKNVELEFDSDFMFPIVSEMCKIESGFELTTELYEKAWANI